MADVDALVTLSKETFFTAFYHLNLPENMEAYASQAFTHQKLEAELHTYGSEFYFARHDNQIAGFIKLNTGSAQNEFKNQNGLELERIYIIASYQRKQIGKQLLNFAFEKARQNHNTFVWLGVWEHNLQAIRFYERYGFTLCGSHNFMLGSDCQTDLLMKKELVLY